MPEYLAPGVYIEEVSFRAKTIEGVSTSTAGFIGPTRFGPVRGEPDLLTSFAEFQRVYGSLDQLQYVGADQPSHNYLAHGVRSFFDEGGRRLYVMRVFNAFEPPEGQQPPAGVNQDGHATALLPPEPAAGAPRIDLRARFPGSGGNMRVNFTARVGEDILIGVPVDPANPGGDQVAAVSGLRQHDLVWIWRGAGQAVRLFLAQRVPREDAPGQTTWQFVPEGGPDDAITLEDLDPGTDQVRVIVVDIEVEFLSPAREVISTRSWQGLTFHPEHRDSLSRRFAADLVQRSDIINIPLIIRPSSQNAAEIARLLLDQPRSDDERARLTAVIGGDAPAGELGDFTVLDLIHPDVLSARLLNETDWRVRVEMTGGNDGVRPTAESFEGEDADDPNDVTGLRAFEGIADISIVAAPGHTADLANDAERAQSDQITRHLIGHAERMRYRIAVLDSRNGQSISEVRALRGRMDSTHAALYYPWITIMDPVTEQQINIPPSGSMAGIYARNDVDHGVHKAPANEVIRQAIGLERLLNKAHQDVLNPEGINCLRFFEGRGYRVWGARTISSDPEWKYVQLRRYFAYLERSVERGTQWVVFENNHEPLWARVRRTVEDFLFNEWSSERLMGEKPDLAYFVRCDRSTMTQNDIDNGRLICLIGVAPVRPAEFVIFRIGQWTADRRA